MDDLYSGKKAVVGIIGLGYVGMPLALAAWTAGFRVVGFDIDPQKAASINAGKSYLRHIPSEEISTAVSAGRLRATTRFEELREVDAIIICVPTPLTAHREPDLTYIESTTLAIAPILPWPLPLPLPDDVGVSVAIAPVAGSPPARALTWR